MSNSTPSLLIICGLAHAILLVITFLIVLTTWARTEVLLEKTFRLEDEMAIVREDIKYQPLVTTLSDAWLRSMGGKVGEDVN